MVDHVDDQNLDRRRFVRKLLTLGATAGVAGILASDLPAKQPVTNVYAASGSGMIIDAQNTGSSGTVLESNWASVSGSSSPGTLNIINDGVASAGVFPTAIYGEVSDVDGVPVFGNNTATSGYGAGVYGVSPSSLGAGVFGESTDTSTSGEASGVYGQSTSIGGQGVYGHAEVDTPNLVGVLGDTPSTTGGIGVYGIGYATSGGNAGVLGDTFAPTGAGTQGNAWTNGGIGVLARSRSAGANPLVAWAASGQTASLQEWWNTSGAALSVVDANGNAGIGTTTPTSPLDVIGSGFEEIKFLKSGGTQPSRLHATGDGINRFAVNQSYDGTNFNLDNTSDNGVSFLINSNASASGIFAIQYISPGSNPDNSRIATNYLFMTANGNVGLSRVPTANNLEVEGNASKATAGSWLANSDMRIKTEISDIDDALATIRKLHPVGFKYADWYRTKHPSIKDRVYYNFIAQEYREVFPDSVQDDGTGLLQMDSHNTIPYLVRAAQELSQQNERLNEAVKEQQTEIERLKLAAKESEEVVQTMRMIEAENKAMREEIKVLQGIVKE